MGLPGPCAVRYGSDDEALHAMARRLGPHPISCPQAVAMHGHTMVGVGHLHGMLGVACLRLGCLTGSASAVLACTLGSSPGAWEPNGQPGTLACVCGAA